MKTKRNLFQIRLLCAGLLHAAMAGFVAHAATINWTNTTSSGWNTAANWNPNTVPGTTDTAIISLAGVTVSLNSDTTVGAIILGTSGAGTTLSLNGQTLSLNGPLTVNPSGSFTVDGGVLSGNVNAVLHGTIGWSTGGSLTGTLTLAPDGTLNIMTGNNHDLPNCAFTNNGSVIWSGGQVRCGGTYFGSPGTTIINNGLWDVQGDLTLTNYYTWNGTVFNNLGTFRKSAGISSSNTVIGSSVMFNQLAGVVEVRQGNLVLQGGGSFMGGTATNNNGVLSLGSGSFTLNGTATGTNVIQNGGNLSGATVIQGGLQWQAGNWTGASSVTLNAGGVLYVNTTEDHDLPNCAFTNSGSVIWSGGQVRCGGTYFGSPGTTIINNGLWDVQGDLTLANYYTWNGTVFNNLGTFRKSAGKSSSHTLITDGVVFNQLAGAVDVRLGNLVLQGGGSLTGGTATNDNGVLSLAGGSYTLHGTVTGTKVIENGGNLAGANVIQGALQWQAGNWTGASSVTLDAGGVLYVNTSADHDLPNCTFTNNGLVIWSGGQVRCGGSYFESPGTTIINNGLWDAQGDLTLNNYYGNWIGTVFNNSGTFRKSAGTGTTTIASGVSFHNTGQMDAQSGNIALLGDYSLANGTQMSFGLGGPAGNGSISLAGAASFAGSLNVNLNNFYWPAAGSTFNLLNYTAESGVLFTNTTLPAPGYLAWQTNYNPTAFALTLSARIATNTVSTNLILSTLDGTNLILQWPGDHTSWRIQAQTNPVTVGLSTNWATLAGSSLTNQFVMPIDKTNGTVFFRMVYP